MNTQSGIRLGLRRADYTPVVYNPLPYEPVEYNSQLPNEVAHKIETRSRELMVQEGALAEAASKLRDELPNDEDTNIYFNTVLKGIQDEIDQRASVGDTEGAIQAAYKGARRLLSDESLSYRKKAWGDYKKLIDETHNRMIQKRISRDTEEWWRSNNPFKYEDKFDANGTLIGGTNYWDMQTPIDDIPLAELTKAAFDFVSEKFSYSEEYSGANKDIKTTSETHYVTRQSIIDNLKAFFKENPGYRSALYQRYQTELYLNDKYNNDPNTNSDLKAQQNKLMMKNGSPVSFEEFCTRVIEENAIANNLKYSRTKDTSNEISTGSGDEKKTNKHENTPKKPTVVKGPMYKKEGINSFTFSWINGITDGIEDVLDYYPDED